MTAAVKLLDSIHAAPNLAWRLTSTKQSRAGKRLLQAACGMREPEAFLAWVSGFCWTFDPRRPPDARNVPFILWPVQEQAGRQVWTAIDQGGDVLIDKSRDMGATWLCLAAMAWFWLYVPETPMLIASRKEEYVDGRGNPDTLFWKLDYLIGNLPGWMRPKIDRRHMHMANLDNGSVIDGESTNADLGRGGRRKAILLDEFAAVDNGAEILVATADTAPCRIFNSTPKGMGNAFANVRFSGKVPVITLHWADHPAKGAGKRLEPGPDGKKQWTSPWYEAECARRTSRKEIAENLDIDYLGSGESFFDLDVLQRLRSGGGLRLPLARGELKFRVITEAEGRAYRVEGLEWAPEGDRRRLALWCPLAPDAVGRLRPRQDRNYVLFCDIAHGTGASNSVIKVADVAAREEVGSFVCADTPPHELARQAVAMALWFGGQSPAILGWEANGPGGIFGLEVYRLGYAFVLGNINTGIPWNPEDDKIGWHSSRERKSLLLGDLRRAWARDDLITHDVEVIQEAEQYIYYASGAIGPSGLIEEAEGARAAHGDRVIAEAGLILCMGEQARARPTPIVAPTGSFAQRRQDWERQRQQATEW